MGGGGAWLTGAKITYIQAFLRGVLGPAGGGMTGATDSKRGGGKGKRGVAVLREGVVLTSEEKY